MKRTEDFSIVESSTGDTISKKEYISMIYKERALELKRVYELAEQDPSKLSMEDLRLIEKHECINFEKMPPFERYHQTNDKFELDLIKKIKISSKSYMAMKVLVMQNCSMTYTLNFENGAPITKDEDVANVLETSIESWRKIKKELLEHDVLRVVEFEKKKYYKINPCCIGKKKIITPNTYYAFRDYIVKYNILTKFHIMYWDKLLMEEYGIPCKNLTR